MTIDVRPTPELAAAVDERFAAYVARAEEGWLL